MTNEVDHAGSAAPVGHASAWSLEPARQPAHLQAQLPTSSLLFAPLPLEMTTRAMQTALTRPALLDDLDQANAMHARCSLESRFARYHATRQSLTAREWSRLCDPANGTTLITVPLYEPSRVIAITHLLRTPAPHVRELGLLIEDAWQGQGLGTVLAQYAVELARTHTLDCREITAMTGTGNQRMLAILRGLRARVTGRDGPTLDTVIQVEV